MAEMTLEGTVDSLFFFFFFVVVFVGEGGGRGEGRKMWNQNRGGELPSITKEIAWE